MKEIALTRGYVTQVDDEDFEMLSKYPWHAHMDRFNCYARNAQVGWMHRLILQPRPDRLVDHKDGNGLNNQRSNLREVTFAQNAWNSRRRYTGFKNPNRNVYNRGGGHYEATLKTNKDSVWLGYFSHESSAMAAVDSLKRRLRGEFAVTYTEEDPRVCQFCGRRRGVDCLMTTTEGTKCTRCALVDSYRADMTKDEKDLRLAQIKLFDLKELIRVESEKGSKYMLDFMLRQHAAEIQRQERIVELLHNIIRDNEPDDSEDMEKDPDMLRIYRNLGRIARNYGQK